MFNITQENNQMIIQDHATKNRLFALAFSFVGIVLAYYSYPELPDGNAFLGGVLLALLGIIIFFTKKAHAVILDKHARTVSVISVSILGKKKTTTYPLSKVTEVNLQITFDMFTLPGWLLYFVLDGEEETIPLNANQSPFSLSKKSSSFVRLDETGKKIAVYLKIPYHQKRTFEN